jgi:hypothetical protein
MCGMGLLEDLPVYSEGLCYLEYVSLIIPYYTWSKRKAERPFRIYSAPVSGLSMAFLQKKYPLTLAWANGYFLSILTAKLRIY